LTARRPVVRRTWPAILLVLLLVVPATAGAVSLQPIGTFSAPIHVAAPPGDASRLFVVERGGTVRVVKDGVVLAQPFLTIAAGEISTDGERGLLAMAFAADYATSGRLYTYSTDAGGDIRIDQWRRSADPDLTTGVRSLVLRIEHSSRSNHNGGDLQIGPDNLLYASTGDGGGSDDLQRIVLPGIRKVIQPKTSGQSEYLKLISENHCRPSPLRRRADRCQRRRPEGTSPGDNLCRTRLKNRLYSGCPPKVQTC